MCSSGLSDKVRGVRLEKNNVQGGLLGKVDTFKCRSSLLRVTGMFSWTCKSGVHSSGQNSYPKRLQEVAPDLACVTVTHMGFLFFFLFLRKATKTQKWQFGALSYPFKANSQCPPPFHCASRVPCRVRLHSVFATKVAAHHLVRGLQMGSRSCWCFKLGWRLRNSGLTLSQKEMFLSVLLMTGILRHFLETVVQDSGRCDIITEGTPALAHFFCTLHFLLCKMGMGCPACPSGLPHPRSWKISSSQLPLGMGMMWS